MTTLHIRQETGDGKKHKIRLNIRRYRPGEETTLWRIYHDTTHIINGKDYTPEQCERWAPADPDMSKWQERIRTRNPFVAEENGELLGFAELESDGHIDYFYCHHARLRRGAGTKLYEAVEAEAKRLGLSSLHASVSVTAKPFFLCMGFRVVKEQQNIVCGSIAPNSIMRKELTLAKKGEDESMKDECCSQFDPTPWNEATLTWEGKRFVRDRVTSFLHIPLNFGGVMKRNMKVIEAIHAEPATQVVLSDENSLWGSDVYIEVTQDIPNAKMATITGTFLSKVYEGPYQNVRKWIEDMKAFVSAKGKSMKKIYFFYTTCPKCAKKYGKNYVVILAQI